MTAGESQGVESDGRERAALPLVDRHPLLGALIIAGLVEVEKVADGDSEGYGEEAERGGMRGASVALKVRQALGEGKE